MRCQGHDRCLESGDGPGQQVPIIPSITLILPLILTLTIRVMPLGAMSAG
jgi:hypothetical protein